MRESLTSILYSYVDALRPIIYINHFDFPTVDAAIQKIADGKKVIEFNPALGVVDFEDKHPVKNCSLEEFLRENREEGYNGEVFLLLKDIHHELDRMNTKYAQITALLRRIAEDMTSREGYSLTVFLVSGTVVVPPELENYITIVNFPLPDLCDITQIIRDYVKDMDIPVEDAVVDELSLSFKGMNEYQIRQILNLAYQDGGTLERNDKGLILREKEQLIRKAGTLELVNFSESLEDIGGLENLKAWLNRKAIVFNDLDRAIKYGVDIPKGIMLVGMPGCGKSLTAKVTASMFSVPLVRLDIGRLLGKYVGESEENMRRALHLAEAFSPCVLWVDEIEKAFSGVGSDGGGSEVTTRLFGQFLTWMQEKDNAVFIVATANDITKIPPEFLRKGRFDEMFFVNLPNEEERKKILEIHLRKRNKWNSALDIISLLKETTDFSGADLEAVVKETVEYAFVEGKDAITTEMLRQTIKDTKSTKEMLSDKMEEIQRRVKTMSIKSASLEPGQVPQLYGKNH